MSLQQKLTGDTRLPQAGSVGEPQAAIKALATLLSTWLQEIQRRLNVLIDGEFELLQLGPVITEEPVDGRKKTGTVGLSDGDAWEPGQGPGIYRYDGSAWWKLHDGSQGFIDLKMITAEPPSDQKKNGVIAYADGTSWNPGSGKGIYYYNGSAWILLG